MGCLKLTYSQEKETTFLKVWKNPKTTSQKVGCLDYGARFFDPSIAKFSTIDPLSEEYNSYSPYHYALNNPVRYSDFMGMGAEEEGKEEAEKKQQQKPKEITEADVDKIVENLPENFTTGDMLTAVVGALNENENAFISGSTIKSFGEKKAKEQLEKLDPDNPQDKEQIDLINEGLKSSDEVFKQIDRIEKTGNEVSVVPTGDEVVIDAKINVTIKKDNKITIEKASPQEVRLSVEGIKIGPTNLRKAVITPKGYEIDIGRFVPNITGDF